MDKYVAYSIGGIAKTMTPAPQAKEHLEAVTNREWSEDEFFGWLIAKDVPQGATDVEILTRD